MDLLDILDLCATYCWVVEQDNYDETTSNESIYVGDYQMILIEIYLIYKEQMEKRIGLWLKSKPKKLQIVIVERMAWHF